MSKPRLPVPKLLSSPPWQIKHEDEYAKKVIEIPANDARSRQAAQVRLFDFQPSLLSPHSDANRNLFTYEP